MRKALVLGSVAAMALGLAWTAAPANAAAGDTLVTFTVGTPGATVSIAPGLFVPGTGGTNYVDGTIVSVVTDLRTTGASWSDSVTSTSFTLVGASPQTTNTTILPGAAQMWTPTAVVAIPGTAVVSNSYPDSGHALTLSGTATPLVSATTANVNTVTLTSTLKIDTTGKSTGAYTGTVTQTVS